MTRSSHTCLKKGVLKSSSRSGVSSHSTTGWHEHDRICLQSAPNALVFAATIVGLSTGQSSERREVEANRAPDIMAARKREQEEVSEGGSMTKMSSFLGMTRKEGRNVRWYWRAREEAAAMRLR